ncbi:MAG: TIGR00266 family protein [Candidatus Thermoplasmatota archaeon]|nr:TIGR00266 family protein [Candidatus Thermoplasmatota archaeon]
MQEHFEFNPSYAMLTLAMSPGEQIKSEPGAMVSMQGCEMSTGSSGGFLKGLKKMALGGESFFLNTFTAGPAGGWVSLAPSGPGDIQAYDVSPGRELFIQGGSYLASTMGVETDTKFQGMKGLFSGESAFFIRAFTQQPSGRVYFNSFGAIKAIPVQPGQMITVDTGHVVAFESTVQYTVNKVGGLKSFAFGGEGLVMNFTGQGTVWIQTRNFSSLVDRIMPFLPTGR